jgi:hypothetical protein
VSLDGQSSRLERSQVGHSVRGTTARLRPLQRVKIARALLGIIWSAILMSGPGQPNTFASLTTIQERSSSSPRRRFVSDGISTASAEFSGGECVTGTTVTLGRRRSSSTASTTAQGRSFTPSSRPRKCFDATNMRSDSPDPDTGVGSGALRVQVYTRDRKRQLPPAAPHAESPPTAGEEIPKPRVPGDHVASSGDTPQLRS